MPDVNMLRLGGGQKPSGNNHIVDLKCFKGSARRENSTEGGHVRYNLQKRLTRLERSIHSEEEDSFTLEEYCRALWRSDKRHYLEVASEPSMPHLRFYIGRFEYEDAERSRER